jgi:hypothetical protein
MDCVRAVTRGYVRSLSHTALPVMIFTQFQIREKLVVYKVLTVMVVIDKNIKK